MGENKPGGDKVIAVQGLYENGRIELSEEAPMEKANVIFPEAQTLKNNIIANSAKQLFDEFTGCISRDLDEKAERLGALDEKCANFD